MTVKRLKYERQLRGWSQRQLGEHAHLAPNTISAIERGVHFGWPGELSRLADALGFSGNPTQLTEDVLLELRIAQGA